MVILANGAPSQGVVINQMLVRLLQALPSPPLPAATPRLLSVAQRPVGLSNWRGNETIGPLAPLALKGGRLDAAVLIEVSGSSAANADAAALAVHGALMAARDGLRTDGFLRADGADFSAAVEDTTTNPHIWRKTASYRFLYEYQYLDADAAASLIVRIPEHADLEELDSPERETSVVTGATGRWDDETAPALVLHGPGAVTGLSVLEFIPGIAPTGGVTLLRTLDGAAGPPSSHPDLATFLAAVTGPAPVERHARVAFPTLTDFLTALGAPTADSVVLGDWDLDGVADEYLIRIFPFAAAVELPRFADRFEISYQTVPPDTPFDQKAVLYLRLER